LFLTFVNESYGTEALNGSYFMSHYWLMKHCWNVNLQVKAESLYKNLRL